MAAFNAYRQVQAQRSSLLGLLLVPLRDGHVPLRRAPDVSSAVSEATAKRRASIGPIRFAASVIAASVSSGNCR